MYTLIHPKDSKNPTDDPNPETSNLLPPDPEPTISELPVRIEDFLKKYPANVD